MFNLSKHIKLLYKQGLIVSSRKSTEKFGDLRNWSVISDFRYDFKRKSPKITENIVPQNWTKNLSPPAIMVIEGYNLVCMHLPWVEKNGLWDFFKFWFFTLFLSILRQKMVIFGQNALLQLPYFGKFYLFSNFPNIVSRKCCNDNFIPIFRHFQWKLQEEIFSKFSIENCPFFLYI